MSLTSYSHTTKCLKFKNKTIFKKTKFLNPYNFFCENSVNYFYSKDKFYCINIDGKLEPLNLKITNNCSNEYLIHFLKSSKKNHSKSEVITVTIHLEILSELFNEDLELSDLRVNCNNKNINIHAHIKSFINSIELLLESPFNWEESMFKIKFKEFLLIITQTKIASSLISTITKTFDFNFKKFIDKNIFSSLNMTELAQVFNMSISTFQREFSKNYNQPPSKYFLTERMMKAKSLLINSNKRISDICFECGYKNTVTFNRVFKNYFNSSPSSYRLIRINQKPSQLENY